MEDRHVRVKQQSRRVNRNAGKGDIIVQGRAGVQNQDFNSNCRINSEGSKNRLNRNLLGSAEGNKENLRNDAMDKVSSSSPCSTPSNRPDQCQTLDSSAASEASFLKLEKINRTLGRINGSLKRMGLCDLKQKCRDLELDSRGKRQTVIRRLKEHHRVEHLVAAGVLERSEDASLGRNSDYFVVIDFEATCEEKNPVGYPHEIIEFPAILVSARSKAVVDTFHRFVRPTVNPTLSEFCRTLTGISQETVNAADTFDQVHAEFLRWMEGHGFGVDSTFTVVTDGPFDMGRFLHLQCLQSGIPYPTSYAGHWANIRKCFANFYREEFFANKGGSGPNKLPSLKDMLEALELTFEGTPHHGIDDARNIARVLTYLLKDHAFIFANEMISAGVEKPAAVKAVDRKKLAPGDDRTPWAKLPNVSTVPRWKGEALLNEEKQRMRSKRLLSTS